MSTTSPSNRGLRAKTSDFTGFLRGVGYSSAQARSSQHDLSISAGGTTSLEVPSSADEGTTTPKKKVTRIPLFGRTRKKSNQSATSSPFAASGHTARYSSEVGEQASISRAPSTDRRPSEPLISVRPPPLPTPTNRAHSSSLTSKFAAHFSHSRSSKPAVTETEPAKAAVQSSGLRPTSTQRSASIDSSSTTKSGSTTPRPHPIITVSLSPDDLSEFHDLFSNPAKPPDYPSKIARGTKMRPGIESDVVPSGSKSSLISEPSARRRGQTPASAIAAAARHRQASSISNERPPSPPPKNAKSTSDSKNHDRTDAISTPRQSNSIRESPRSPTAEMEKGIPPSLQRRPSVATGSIQSTEDASPSIRSRMKQPSSPSRSKPPSMPLPQPPTPTMPSLFPSTNQAPNSPLQPSFSGVTRPRAHTFSSSIPPSSLRLSRSATIKSATPLPSSLLTTDKEGFDIETASEAELREALKERNVQYKELTSFVLKNTESYLSQIAALEKKISSLEFEARNHEKTIQGLIHIINDTDSQDQQPKPLPASILSLSRFASSAGSGAESDQDTYKSVRPSIPRRSNYHSDSGGESYATSGAESIRASGGSGTESLTSVYNRTKKVRRTYVHGDPASNLRTGSTLRSSNLPPVSGPPDKSLPEVPVYPSSMKRTSISSMSVSPSSSASSLLLPSPSLTMSSLSAIPEVTPSTLQPPHHGSSEPAEDRRTIHPSHRISMGSLASSSTANSSTYSTSIKRSRPPSIAQVLEKSPKMSFS